MKNVSTFYCHWKKDLAGNVLILNKDFDLYFASSMNRGTEIEVILIDESGISNSKIDAIATEFIRESKAQDRKRYVPFVNKDHFASFPKVFVRFLKDLIASFAPDLDRQTKLELFREMERGRFFSAYIPDDLVPQDKKDNLLGLGPDHLFAAFPPDVIFDYVLPRFYCFLFDNDLLGKGGKETDLATYMVALG